MHISSAEFITSAAKLSQCPVEHYPEFAFFGRSNVGKSSLINFLTQRNTLAKCSNLPGKTRLFNFFLINQARQLVDLPGYGYAKTNDTEKAKWLDMTQEFLKKRKTLKCVFLLIDLSILPQKIDLGMLQVFQEENISFRIVFTKIDKVSQKDRAKHLRLFSEYEKKYGIPFSEAFFVSSTARKGRDELLEFIEKEINLRDY